MAWGTRSFRRFSYAAVAITALGLLPPVQARGKALAVLAEAIGLPFPRPFAAPVARAETTMGGVAGDLYTPGGKAPPILLVPGAARLGKDDPRVVRAATAIARAERVVFVPTLELSNRRFDEKDLDRIVASTTALSERTEEPVTLLGFSYGGSFALVASADPRLSEDLAQVAVFGAYFDLVGVIQAITTGVSLVGDRRVTWPEDPRADQILQEVAGHLIPAQDRELLLEALETEAVPEGLRPGARAMYELLTNRDPARTYELAGGISPSARRILERFSPSSVAERIDVPVVAMHSTDDPAVPYGEALRLTRGIPGTPLETVTLFRHVDFQATDPSSWSRAAGDLWSGWRFASRLLGPQE